MAPQRKILAATLLSAACCTMAAQAATYPAYAEVLEAKKIVQQKQTRTPVKRCTWEQLPSRVRYEHRYGERRVIERRAKRCRTSYQSRTVNEVTGYDVTLRYNGETFTRRTLTHPGTRIPITVEVQPHHEHPAPRFSTRSDNPT